MTADSPILSDDILFDILLLFLSASVPLFLFIYLSSGEVIKFPSGKIVS